MLRIGLISDTHGLLRPEVLNFLRGSDHILHAGDICGDSILQQLAALAPLSAVRGNNDHGPWAEQMPLAETLRFEDVYVHMLHDLADLDLDPEGAGIQAVVCGHSHKPMVDQRGTVLHVNPGSAGPRRFKLPISAGELLVDGGSVTARIIAFDSPRS